MRYPLTRAILPATAVGVALLAVGPLLRPGYTLAYDMVFTPRQPLSASSIGLGPALPRAVPVDAVVAAATLLVDGAIVQKAALVGVFVAAFLGAARACPADRHWVRVAAGLLYAWNPYVAERLFLGSWSVLVGYACLPWALAGALRLSRGDRGGWRRTLLPLAVAAITPTGGLLAVMVAVGPMLAGAAGRTAGRSRLRLAGLLAAGAVLNAPWWVPGALHAANGTDPAGVSAFASRSENASGVVGTVLTFGGIWNRETVPASRGSVLAILLGALVLAVAAAGVPGLARAWGRRTTLGVGVTAAAAVLIALLAAIPGGSALLRWALVELTGAGLLRDAQKWLAPWVLAAALAFGAGAERVVAALGRRGADRLASGALAALAVVLPIAVVPDLAFAGLGRLSPVRYPADWAAVRRQLAARPGTGAVVVLPFTAYRDFPWNGGRTVLDPAPRYLPGEVVIDNSLWVGGRQLAGEDRRAAAIGRELTGAGAAGLASQGVGWVVVQHGVDGPMPDGLLDTLDPVYAGPAMSLYRVPGTVGVRADTGPAAAPVLLADTAAVLLVLGTIVGRPSRRRPVPTDGPLERDAPARAGAASLRLGEGSRDA